MAGGCLTRTRNRMNGRIGTVRKGGSGPRKETAYDYRSETDGRRTDLDGWDCRVERCGDDLAFDNVFTVRCWAETKVLVVFDVSSAEQIMIPATRSSIRDCTNSGSKSGTYFCATAGSTTAETVRSSTTSLHFSCMHWMSLDSPSLKTFDVKYVE
jgi:hypothetical protein